MICDDGSWSMAASQSEYFAKKHNEALMAQMQPAGQARSTMDCNAYAMSTGQAVNAAYSVYRWEGTNNAMVSRLDILDAKKREAERTLVPMIYEDLT